MIELLNWYILIAFLFLGLFFIVKSKKISKYKYLFRNPILSNSKKYELAAILRGRIYYPRYFYIPALKQYLVYSDLDETLLFRENETSNKSDGKTHVLLDENGKNIITLKTPLSFSHRSGCFYGPSSYIPLLESEKKEKVPYHQIYNSELNLGRRDFEKLFIQLYTSSEYIEYINLRVVGDQLHEAGVIFKRGGKVEILLSGVRDSRMIRRFHEDRTINEFDDYYLPDISNKETFPQSDPQIEMIRLETTNTNPFVYWRTGFNREFTIVNYKKDYSEGLQGVARYGCIPIYVLGESMGTTYVRFRTKGETFRIKILEVAKISFVPAYNLGLRTFQLPKKYQTKNSLVFMESAQNGGSNRMGGGVFVVRPAININPSGDIPVDMTEKEFNKLPLNEQWKILNTANSKHQNKN